MQCAFYDRCKGTEVVRIDRHGKTQRKCRKYR